MVSVFDDFQEKFEGNFNPLLLLFLIMVVLANVWMAVNEIFFGVVYLSFFSASVILLVIVERLIEGEPHHSTISKFIRAPFSPSLGMGYLLWFTGFGVAFLFNFILKIVNPGYSITTFSIPLFGNKILSGITQSFAAAEIQASMPWKIFNMMFNAGTTEEWIFNFALIFAFVALFARIGQEVPNNRLLNNRFFVVTISIMLSVILFSGSHALNNTYASLSMFIWAAGFKFISLITIYYFGIYLIAWIGYHMANNLLYLINTEGLQAVFNGFASWFGLFFGFIVIFGVGWLIFRWEQTKEEVKKYVFD